MSYQKTKNDNQRESPLFLVAMVVFVALGFWLLATSRKAPKTSGQTELSSQRAGVAYNKAVDRIDSNMKRTLFQNELARKKMQLENAKLAPGVGPLRPENLIGDPNRVYGVDIHTDDHGKKVQRDLQKYDVGPGYAVTPEQQIRNNLARDQWLEDYDQAFNEQYAKEFVENARRDGVEIQLNDQYEIIGIRRIDKPGEALRIPQSVNKPSDGAR